MNIVLGADESYARYGAVVMASVIANVDDPGQIHFFMLTPGMCEKTKNSLHAFVEDAGVGIDIIDVDAQELQGLKVGRFGTAALLRLLMHCYLPVGCERVIYLDCDVLVRCNLSDLWAMPLGGNAAAAAMDICNTSISATRTYPDDYFNSGVMLIDLTAWRNRRVGERALAYLEKNGENARYPDQDALNYVLEGDCYKLPPAWNFQPTTYAAVKKRYPHLVKYMTSLKTAVRHPCIVHFIGAVKPWHPTCVHPFQEDFIAYSRQTPWPIDRRELISLLSWSERLRIVFKQPKIRRRRRLTKP
ncbi:glycosyltransferase family 8 protein [Vreelandella massiliensis]|uniref:glycosyltransferase family 8 protein n=1 Tax=Vreelandella massiliensis TaxID=1816686 RepID=UPI00096A22DA|nr:glycosyltransferase family 8 protein [Halomonas massiliensis]